MDFGEHTFTDADIPAVEKKMMELAKAKTLVIRKEMSKADAVKYFEEKGDEYKLDLLENLEDGTITFYTQGDFTDLCRGPHIPHTGHVKAAKIMAIAGAYWKGDETQKQLTRVYGVTFTKKSDLKEHLERLEQARARDHRKLGKELDLFHFSEKVGQGLPLWLPKRADLRMRLENFLKEAQRKSGYEPVITPHIGNKELYVTSGHYAKYGEDSFQPINTPAEGEEYLPEAHELSAPLRDFQGASAVLPRFACALGGVWHGVPLRTERRASWLDPGSWIHPRRRAHLLHARPGEGRGRQGH